MHSAKALQDFTLEETADHVAQEVKAGEVLNLTEAEAEKHAAAGDIELLEAAPEPAPETPEAAAPEAPEAAPEAAEGPEAVPEGEAAPEAPSAPEGEDRG